MNKKWLWIWWMSLYYKLHSPACGCFKKIKTNAPVLVYSLSLAAVSMLCSLGWFCRLQEAAGAPVPLENLHEPIDHDSCVTCNGCQLSLLTVWPGKIDNMWHSTGSNLPQLQPPLLRPASLWHKQQPRFPFLPASYSTSGLLGSVWCWGRN